MKNILKIAKNDRKNEIFVYYIKSVTNYLLYRGCVFSKI